MDVSQCKQWLASELAQLTNKPIEAFLGPTSLLELGIDSLDAMRLSASIAEDFKIDLAPMIVFDFPTLQELAEQVCSAVDQTQEQWVQI